MRHAKRPRDRSEEPPLESAIHALSNIKREGRMLQKYIIKYEMLINVSLFILPCNWQFVAARWPIVYMNYLPRCWH